MLGHLVGAAAGWSMLALFHLADNGSALVTGVTWERAVAAGLSLGLTSAVMLLLRAPHPPAGATTLIVSLGIMTQLWQMGVLMLAVALLTAQAVLMNRLAGIPYPLWRAPESPPGAAGPPHS